MSVIVGGTGRSGGTWTVSVCRIDLGSRRRFGTATSIQITPTPDPGTVVARSVGLARRVIEAVSPAPLSLAIVRRRATSRTATERTVTGAGKPFVTFSSYTTRVRPSASLNQRGVDMTDWMSGVYLSTV